MPTDLTWLEGDALEVAPALLGWELVVPTTVGEAAGRIVEVEAYHGARDPASHAYRGPTPRTAPMFERGGTIYVYLSYGIHTCLNIVTGPTGEGQAVLIRALEPTLGQALMEARRGRSGTQLTNGPGKLTQALGITLSMSGSLLGKYVQLRPPAVPTSPASIHRGPRIGISSAQDLPWRFWLADSLFVSKA